MSAHAITKTRARFSPLDPQRQSLAWKAGAVLFGGLFLALSSRIEVPMVPVPKDELEVVMLESATALLEQMLVNSARRWTDQA